MSGANKGTWAELIFASRSPGTTTSPVAEATLSTGITTAEAEP
jgi:hypothetical protein